MPQIYIAALVTIALVVVIYGGALARIAPRDERPLLLVAVLLQLPMSVLAFHLVRLPLDSLLAGWLGGPVPMPVRLLYAPLTEETAKVWPLLLPWFARRVTPANAWRAGVALGLGFGLGEIALLADFVRAAPGLGDMPWYGFGGFISERFMVCLIHGGFTAVSLHGWRHWRGGLVAGLAAAMLLHLLLNLAIPLAGTGVFGTDPAVIGIILSVWVAVYWLVIGGVLIGLAARGSGGVPGVALLGTATCPDCGTTYPRPLLAFNLGWKRYERCPSCRKWHLL